jgi:hypothetical protein
MGFPGQDGFNPLGKVATLQEDPVTAIAALNADIRTQADYLPFPAAARVGFPQLNDVAQGEIGKHTGIITTPRSIQWMSPW